MIKAISGSDSGFSKGYFSSHSVTELLQMSCNSVYQMQSFDFFPTRQCITRAIFTLKILCEGTDSHK